MFFFIYPMYYFLYRDPFGLNRKVNSMKNSSRSFYIMKHSSMKQIQQQVHLLLLSSIKLMVIHAVYKSEDDVNNENMSFSIYFIIIYSFQNVYGKYVVGHLINVHCVHQVHHHHPIQSMHYPSCCIREKKRNM